MPTDHCRKSGQIPAFGDWENAGELPITQYFECARQAGLLRCSCSSGECPAGFADNNTYNVGFWGGGADGHAAGFERPPPRRVGFEKPPPRRIYSAPQHKARGFDKGYSNDKELRKQQVEVRYLMHHPRNHRQCHPKQSNKQAYVASQQQTSTFTAKPVDEDLYKIPSELLRDNSKGKKVLGFFRRCMVSPCAA